MSRFEQVKQQLREQPKKWLITGRAGFIGSNLLETLLKLDQTVVGLDNFATGHQHNLDEVKAAVDSKQWDRFNFIQGDIRDITACRDAVRGIDYVLHHAALGSVPRSVENPLASNDVNISGFLNMLVAAKDASVTSFVYAASSSTYGDHPDLPKIESRIGKPLSPYSVTKYVNELYAQVFSKCYNFHAVGLRYFNVFGKRQDPSGHYAAVIPLWISSMIKGGDIYINGDGSTSRDFCFVENAVQANILSAASSELRQAMVLNVAFGGRTNLLELFQLTKRILNTHNVSYDAYPIHREARKGDVLHSQADIGAAKSTIGYIPSYSLADGLEQVIPWYVARDRKTL